MTQYLKPFEPVAGGTIKVANSVTASVVASLPDSCDVVAIYNGDTAAVAFFRCQPYGSTSAGPTPTVAVADTDIPIGPGQQIRISVPKGPKKFSMVASAATGSCWITPGIGN
jgi:protein involved in polysaccharide export with SLBB domain